MSPFKAEQRKIQEGAVVGLLSSAGWCRRRAERERGRLPPRQTPRRTDLMGGANACRSMDGVVATGETVQARLREGRTLGSTVVKGPMKRSLRQRLGRSRWRNGSIPRPCLGARCGKHIREGCLEKGAGWE